MPKILLSIHRNHADDILSGRKTIELRKTFPNHIDDEIIKGGATCYLYMTGSGTVIGECKIKGFAYLDGFPGNEILEQSCVSAKEYSDYAKDDTVFGWAVENPSRYKEPKPLSDFGFDRAPQSWRYVHEQPA